jgi:meso-butanediol dehydrogenase/(S,S)-butanediol dehydrogenase/diacetyl reductase
VTDRLHDSVAIVTGAGSGIGAAIAAGLAAEGAAVVVADVRADEAERQAESIRTQGGQAVAIGVEVRERSEQRAAVELATARYGKLDVIFNNAGINEPMPFLELDEDNWRKTLDVNALGVLIGMQEAARQFIAQGGGGKIVNTISAGARLGLPYAASYAASKYAVHALVHSGARALARYDITVAGIAPGIVDTPIWDAPEGHLSREEVLERYAAPVIKGRPATPADIVPTAVFLASHDSDYFTGQVIMIDGGLSLT